MEFVEYLQIIRRRIWIAVVMAGLTAAVVVGARLMPEEKTHPAAGRVLVHELAKRQIVLQGNEVVVGQPQEEGAFWNDFGQFAGSAQVRQVAAQEIGLAPGEAQQQLDNPTVQRLANSSVAQVVAEATGRASGLATGSKSAHDLAVRYCQAVMESLGELWRSRTIARLELARNVLQQRRPSLEAEKARIEREADQLATRYAGIAPTGVRESLTAELTAIEEQIASAEVSKGAAEARSEVLASRGDELVGTTGAARSAAFNPRVAALQEAIAQKQIQLDEQLGRRTRAHPDIQALEAEIDRLTERLAEVREEEATGISPQGAAAAAEAAVTAEVEAAALNRRLELLRERAGEIRNRLPTVRADARVYEDVMARLTGTQAALATLDSSIDRLDAEEEQVANATLIEPLTEAEPQHIPRGLTGFAIKLAVAIVTGGGLGILVIFVLHYVDFSFQDEQEAEQMLGVRVLAGIPRSDIEPQPVAEGIEQREPEEDETDAGIL